MAKHLIINADDFGASTGINRGILECHTRGVLTSASLMVTGRAVREAVDMAGDHPDLSIGLHWDVCGEDERSFDTRDLPAVRDEFRRQLEEFERLVGKLPTHFDSHRHAHREKHIFPLFRELVAPTGRPLRGDGRARFTGGFYGQWEWLVTDLEHVSVAYLERLLREEVLEGWNEISCHPGYESADFRSVYMSERPVEVATLTDPRIREAVDRLGIRLESFRDIPPDTAASAARPGEGRDVST